MASTGTKDSTSNQPVNLSEETKELVKAMNLFYEALTPVSKSTEQVREIIYQSADLIDRIHKETRRVTQDSCRVHKLSVDLKQKRLAKIRAYMRAKAKLQKLVASIDDLVHAMEENQTEHEEKKTTEDDQDGSDEYGDDEDGESSNDEDGNDEDGNDEHCE